jgi:hypothetical protein
MAPTSPRLLATLALIGLLAAGCSGSPAPRTQVGSQQTTAPSPSDPVTSEEPGVVVPATPNTPDLSDAVIDCDAIEEPCDRGEDPDLDVLWDACADGDGRACDRLYYDAGFDTRYEQFGNTCGDRDVLVPCAAELS